MAAHHRCSPTLFLVLSLAAFAGGCHGPLQPLALSPHGHGGPLQSRGPSPITPLWRANAMSAPMVQRGCRSHGTDQSLLCAVPHPTADLYARALAAASDAEIDPPPMAEPDGGV